ncbi:MAG: hypothetical protein HKP20_06850 [Akkermansiaceae bacterium]|nr:hypothetical protein [Akkermansiaceae bacterium]
MNQCLGFNAGNALEVIEAVDFLTGKRQSKRLKEVVMGLCSELLLLSKLAENKSCAENMLNAALDSGKAAEIFGEMVYLLGGPADLIDNYSSHLATASVVRPVPSEKQGYVSAIDTRQLGLSIVQMGGGRTRAEDQIDPAVGLSDVISIGASSDQSLATVHAQSEDAWQQAAETIRSAITFTQSPVSPPSVIHEVIR